MLYRTNTMHLLATLILLVTATLAAGKPKSSGNVILKLEDEKYDSAKPCCIAMAYEARVMLQTNVAVKSQGMTTVEEYQSRFIADWQKEVLVVDAHTIAGALDVTLREILHLKSGNGYILSRGTCKVVKLPMDRSGHFRCIPKDASYLGEATFGIAPGALVCNQWQYMKSSQGPPAAFNLNITSFMQRDTCVPTVQWSHGTFKGFHVYSHITMMDFKAGISDRDIMDVPAYCPKASTMDVSSLSRIARHMVGHHV